MAELDEVLAFSPHVDLEVASPDLNTTEIEPEIFQSSSGLQIDEHPLRLASESHLVRETPCPRSQETSPSIQESATGNVLIDFSEYFLPRATTKLRLETFLDFHSKSVHQLPDGAKLRPDKTERGFLVHQKDTDLFFCKVCLAFCETNDKSRFVVGSINNVKHNSTRFYEHERSKSHRNYSEALLLHEKQSDVNYLIAERLVEKAKREIIERRQVLERIVEIAKFIGKRGLSYRGDKHESASSLNEENLDHGNFLELTLLLAKFDPTLKNHIDKISKNQQEHSKGRGDSVTFLSKTTFNYLFESFHDLMMEIISDEVNKAGIFSIQIDSCQDITVKEQVSIVLRYFLDGKVHETFAGFVECRDTSGKAMFNLISEYLKKHKIDIKKCVASATDGASNMRGEYQGFQAYLSSASEEQIYVWCTSHVLNLIMTEACKGNIIVIELFDCLSESARLVKYSYKRSNMMRGHLSKSNLKRLQIICKTRWWSSEKSPRNLFGPIGKQEEGLFVALILVLEALSEDTKIDCVTRSKANGLLQKLTKFTSILTAFLFQQIFSITTPLSKYLQTKCLDILKATQMVETACSDLKELSLDSDAIVQRANDFLAYVNSKLVEAESSVEMNNEFPKKRGRRRKRFFDEDRIDADKNADELEMNSPMANFKSSVINETYKTIINLFEERFSNHKDLARDLNMLDPSNFPRLSKLPVGAFDTLCRKLKYYFNDFDESDFLDELQSLAKNWPRFKKDIHSEYEEQFCSIEDDIEILIALNDNDQINVDNSEFSDDSEPNENYVPEYAKCEKSCQSAEGCSLCVILLLEKYNMYSMCYKNAYLAYKYVLTLSVGQVECERSFSKMKFIKNRLRSSLSEDNFSHLTLIYCERRLLTNIQNSDVIDRLSQRSQKLSKLLTIK